MEDWAVRLKKLMDAMDLGQPDIVRVTGAKQSSVRQWFKESPKPSTKMIRADNAVAAAKLVDSTVEYLITGKNKPKESQAARPDDETMAQAIQVLYMVSASRPQDKRFKRISWPLIQVSAKAIERCGDDHRKIVEEILSAVERG